jgi:hypothetical protein
MALALHRRSRQTRHAHKVPTPAEYWRRDAQRALDQPIGEKDAEPHVAAITAAIVTTFCAPARAYMPAHSIRTGMHIHLDGYAWSVRHALHRDDGTSVFDLHGVLVQIPSDQMVGVV